MTKPKPTVCAKCGEAIVFRNHARTGNAAPITVATHDDGNIAINADDTYRIIATGEDYSGHRYLNHFTNCSAAPFFKTRKAVR